MVSSLDQNSVDSNIDISRVNVEVLFKWNESNRGSGK